MAIALCLSPSTSSTLPSRAGVLAKSRDFGQEAAHFDLRVDAGFELAIDFHDIFVVDQRRAVGLFGFNGANMLRRFDGLVGEAVGRPEFEAQAIFLDGQGLPQIAQQKRDEDLVGRDIQQRSFPRALPHRGESARVVALAIETHPLDLHRQHIARGRAALRWLRKTRARAGCRRYRRTGPPRSASAGSPSAERSGYQRRSRQISRQHVAFEYAAGAGQRHPCRAERDHERLEFRHDRSAPRAPIRRARLSWNQ